MPGAIHVENVSKLYRRADRRRRGASLKSALLTGRASGDSRRDDFVPALIDVTFEVKAGETVGVIGPTRMHYSRAIALVDGTTQAVSRVLREAH